jgi:RND family efflux transporter MFP subunit
MANSSAGKQPVDLSALRIDRSSQSDRPGGGTRKLLWGLLAVAVLVALVALAVRFRGAVSGGPEVRIGTVRVISPNRADSILTANGYLVSRTQAAIGAKVSGRVEQILVEEGDRVEKDGILAILEHADLDASLGAARAALSRARADVIEAEANLTEDRRDVTRKQSLLDSGIGSRETLEKAEAKRDASAARLDALRQQVALSEALVRESQERLENMFIRAPFSGTVISKDAEVGETITPGGMGAASGRGSVVTLADLASLEVETDVKEDYIGRIRLGQPARIDVDAVPERSYEGRLRQIIPMGDRSRAVIQVKVEVLDADERLFPEMSATVHFIPDETPRAEVDDRPRVYAPAAAVREVDGGRAIWIVRDDRVSSVTVVTGRARDDLIEIREGLSGGERVVLDPPADLSEGVSIRPAP